eukprot:UN2472
MAFKGSVTSLGVTRSKEIQETSHTHKLSLRGKPTTSSYQVSRPMYMSTQVITLALLRAA